MRGAGRTAGKCAAKGSRGVCRRAAVLMAALILEGAMLAGCGSAGTQEIQEASAEETSADEELETAEEAAEEEAAEEIPAEEETVKEEDKIPEDEEISEEETAAEVSGIEYDGTQIRVGSLSGPTTMGIVNLMDSSDHGESAGNYTFTIGAEASEVVALVSTGDIDIGMIPANLAANLYNKTEGGVTVIDINTLGVLYCVTGDESVTSIAGLAGRSVLTTGQGATPEYALNYLLDACGVEDCTVEFYSESTEVAALLQEDPAQIAVLPQPFVTSAEMQNEALRTAFSLTDVWDGVTENGSMLITGATVVRTAFLEEHPDAVAVFLAEHASSAEAAADDIEGTAQLVADYGILASAAIAQKALPECNIVCITGEEMEDALTGYLEVLYAADPASVGGALPAEDFYYIAQ